MHRKNIVKRIGYLQDKHECGSCNVKKCPICTEIRELGKLLEYNPKVQAVLDKGSDMKKADIEFLRQKEVPNKVIAKALGMHIDAFKRMYYMQWGSVREGNRERIVEITRAAYKRLKQQGLSEFDVAKMINISYKLLHRWKQENLTPQEIKDLKLSTLKNQKVV